MCLDSLDSDKVGVNGYFPVGVHAVYIMLYSCPFHKTYYCSSFLSIHFIGNYNLGSAHLIPNIPRVFWEIVVEPLTLALTSRTDISPITSHDQWPAVFLLGFCYCFPLKCPCALHRLASNESSDCNIFSGATQSSVKSSDCVTNFPVQGGIAVDCVPVLRMWFFGLIQYKHWELEGGSLVVELSIAQPRSWFVRERYQTARLKFFTWQKQLFVYISHSVLICQIGSFCHFNVAKTVKNLNEKTLCNESQLM